MEEGSDRGARGRAVTAERVRDYLSGYSYTFAAEIELQDGLEHVLSGMSLGEDDLTYERENRLGPGDRIDFLLDCGVGIEVKVAGQTGRVAEQLIRYAGYERVRELLLVTSVVHHLQIPASLCGKPVSILWLSAL